MKFCLALIALLISSCTSASGRADIESLRADIPSLMEIAEIPGISIAVVENGRVAYTGAFGTLNDSAQTALNSETVFEAASLSKPVFGYIVLRLADRGEFDLDRPLFEMLEYPRLTHDERYKRITARMALSHGTGLPNWGDDQLTLAFEPGTAFQYSGEGFVFLQRVIEMVTGSSLEELARREVFEPLGMTHSSFVWQERFASNAAYAKDLSWNIAPIGQSPDANAAASLLTTATDYARFMVAVLNGTGLSTELWNEFLEPVRATDPAAETSTYFGLGIGVDDGPAGRSFFHSGNNGNRFVSYMVGYPDKGLGFVYLTNVGDGTSVAEALAAHVIRNDRPTRRQLGGFRYDDPQWLAEKSVQRAAVEGGSDAARKRFQITNSDPATRLSLDGAIRLAEFLTARLLATVAVEVIEAAVEDNPESVRAQRVFARALLSAGDHHSALESYRRLEAIDAADSDTRRRIQWIEERLETIRRPVAVPLPTLQSYVGRYQVRQITMRDGRLYYRRDGGPEHALIPMTQDMFALEGAETFRVRFVRNGSGPAERIMGIDIDGWSNEMARSADEVNGTMSPAIDAPPELGRETVSPDLVALARRGGASIRNRTATALVDAPREGLHLDGRPDDGIVWIEEVAFENGVIDVDVRGRDEPGRSFVGIAFRGVDDETYESIYLRPFNFRAGEPQRSRAVQYISLPDHPWERLRREHPGQYEASIDPAPHPEDWVHLRVVLDGAQVKVWVNSAEEPVLTVNRIGDRSSGRLGLWVGNNSEGDFANLTITPR